MLAKAVLAKAVLAKAVLAKVKAGTYTVARTAQSLTAGPFAGVVAVLVWLQLVARLYLLCVAWTAVVTDNSFPIYSKSKMGRTD